MYDLKLLSLQFHLGNRADITAILLHSKINPKLNRTVEWLGKRKILVFNELRSRPSQPYDHIHFTPILAINTLLVFTIHKENDQAFIFN
jgi:hypothetical protein